MYYNRQGEPISRDEWSATFEDFEKSRRVGFTEYGGIQVSTVWLGLDHSFGRDGPPLIFETMVFRKSETEEEYGDECWRWSTEEQARAGHVEICSGVFRDVDISAGDIGVSLPSPPSEQT